MAELTVHADWLVPDWHAEGVGALMTTRHGGISAPPFDSMNLRACLGDDPRAVAANTARLAQATGAVLLPLNQVHGARVVRLTAADTAPGAPLHDADASVTTEPGLALVVQVADCAPVLFAAPNGRAVAAAHAGWRGLAAGVLEATLTALCDAATCSPDDVQAWLGACIGPGEFEVGADVLDAFGVAHQRAPGTTAEVTSNVTSKIPPSAASACFVPRQAPGKWLADLPGLARAALARAGVRQVYGGTWCTAADPSRFFSFRRDGVTGRMVAAVWVRHAGRRVG